MMPFSKSSDRRSAARPRHRAPGLGGDHEAELETIPAVNAQACAVVARAAEFHLVAAGRGGEGLPLRPDAVFGGVIQLRQQRADLDADAGSGQFDFEGAIDENVGGAEIEHRLTAGFRRGRAADKAAFENAPGSTFPRSRPALLRSQGRAHNGCGPTPARWSFLRRVPPDILRRAGP